MTATTRGGLTRRPLLILVLWLTGTGVAWQQLLHARLEGTEAGEPPLLLHWLRDSAPALPAVLLAVLVGVGLAVRLLQRWPAATPTAHRAAVATAAGLAAAVALSLGSPVHAWLFGGAAHHHDELPLSLHLLRDGLLGLPVTLLVARALLARAPRRRRAGSARRGVARLAVTAFALGSLALLTPTVPAAAAAGPCPAGARPITYDLASFQNVIPLNGWGDRIPDGLQYGLTNDDARVGEADIKANPNLSQPLVVRADVGDCITVRLRNDIAGRRVGLHPDGLVQFDRRPPTAPASAPTPTPRCRPVGRPPTPGTPTMSGRRRWWTSPTSTTPRPARSRMAAPTVGQTSGPRAVSRRCGRRQGVHPSARALRGDRRPPEGLDLARPRTGANLLSPSGVALQTEVFADIHSASAPSSRSFAMIFMDETEDVVNRDGRLPIFPSTGLPDSTFGINYRSEPLRNRLRAILEHRGTVTPENPSGEARTITLPNGRTYRPEDHFCDGYVPELGRVVEDPGAQCMSEESHLQSWVFGDEGKLSRTTADGSVTDTDHLIPKAYQGDKIRFHLIHPGAKETHPWHQHTQRWFADPDNPQADRSPRKDVQSVSPGESYPLEIEGGAGGLQGTIGDSIFHCHLYPHFAGGFWGHLRIFDRLRDGSQSYPDGTPLERLRELPDRVGAIPAPDAQHPGFPLFVKGDVGQRAYRIPGAVVKDSFAALRRPGDAPRRPTVLEAANLPALDPAKPGAGYIDPCPAGAPSRVYRPHTLDMKLVYNKAGWADRQGRLYVEESHKAAVLAGREKRSLHDPGADRGVRDAAPHQRHSPRRRPERASRPRQPARRPLHGPVRDLRDLDARAPRQVRREAGLGRDQRRLELRAGSHARSDLREPLVHRHGAAHRLLPRPPVRKPVPAGGPVRGDERLSSSTRPGPTRRPGQPWTGWGPWLTSTPARARTSGR